MKVQKAQSIPNIRAWYRWPPSHNNNIHANGEANQMPCLQNQGWFTCPYNIWADVCDLWPCICQFLLQLFTLCFQGCDLVSLETTFCTRFPPFSSQLLQNQHCFLVLFTTAPLGRIKKGKWYWRTDNLQWNPSIRTHLKSGHFKLSGIEGFHCISNCYQQKPDLLYNNLWYFF